MCPRDAATACLAERDSVTAWEASSPREHRTLSFNRELVVSFCTRRMSRPLDLQRRHVLSYEAGVSPPIAGVTSRTATQHRAADTAVARVRASPRCPGVCPSTYVAVVFRLIICFRLVPGLTPVTPAVGGGGSRTPAAPLPTSGRWLGKRGLVKRTSWSPAGLAPGFCRVAPLKSHRLETHDNHHATSICETGVRRTSLRPQVCASHVPAGREATLLPDFTPSPCRGGVRAHVPGRGSLPGSTLVPGGALIRQCRDSRIALVHRNAGKSVFTG